MIKHRLQYAMGTSSVLMKAVEDWLHKVGKQDGMHADHQHQDHDVKGTGI